MIGNSVEPSGPNDKSQREPAPASDAKTTPVVESVPITVEDVPQPVRVGELFLGKYRIERLLGRGGMGVVMAARHERLDERVAIKFLGSAGVGQKVALARFEREARAAAKIKNEHVAQVMDVGVFGEGSAYMVVEYLEGHDLAVEVDDKGALAVSDAVDYVLQAIDALADAHALGIVHRDLKPSNLFLTRRASGAPLVKVLDFGIAKSESSTAGDGADSLTATNTIMGSPRYMSPEQIRSTKTTDHRSDIWSLGVILYELLTGAAPFEGETSTELFAAVLMDSPRPPRALRAELPEALEAVILRCLTRDREQRFQGVGALAAALAPFAPPRSQNIVSRFAGDAAALPTDKTLLATETAPPTKQSSEPSSGGAAAQTDTSWTPLEPAHRRSTLTAGVLGFVAVLGLGALAWLFWLSPLLQAESRLEAESVPEPVTASAAAAPAPALAPAPPPPGVSPLPSAAESAPTAAAPAPSTARARKPKPPARTPAAPPAVAPPASKPRSNVLEARE